MRRREWLRPSRCGRRSSRSPFSTNASDQSLSEARNLQRTGSFKFRGAFNKLASIPQDKRSGGVVAFSSGNHAQGVAAAAQILSMRATIVMPADSPVTKRERTKGYGAEVVLYDRDKEDREAIANGIAAKHGATLGAPMRSLCDRRAGTAGREIAEDMAALGLVPISWWRGIGRWADRRRCDGGEAKFRKRQIIVAEPRTMTTTAFRCAPATARPISRRPHTSATR